MILMDYSGVSIAAIMGQVYGQNNVLDEDLVRHIILNSVRKYNSMFRSDYGRLVICTDSRNNWRYNIFPEYKAARKVKKETDIDWRMIYDVMDQTEMDLIKYFPYDVFGLDTYEADDLIGQLAINSSQSLGEDVMIVSSDHDFADQLLIYDDIHAYTPKHKKEIIRSYKEADDARRTHIMRGDPGDGVPNILSDDDTFINENKRQKQLRQTKVDLWLSMSEDELMNALTNEQKRNYDRNKAMVSFQDLDDEFVYEILTSYDSVLNRRAPFSLNNLMTFFAKNKMKYLASCIQDFAIEESRNITPLTSALN